MGVASYIHTYSASLVDTREPKCDWFRGVGRRHLIMTGTAP